MTPALTERGIHVRQLVMLDSYVGTALPLHGQVVDESMLLAAFAIDLGVDIGFAMGLSSQPLASAKHRLLQMLHDAGLTPTTFEADQLQQAFTRFCANHRALQHYQPHMQSVETTLIRATANPLLAQAPANLGWQSLEGNVNIVDTASDHYAVVTNANTLIALIRLVKIVSETQKNKSAGIVMEET
jgi:thioesterase domain-containing protein